jgi:hypothetical protein
LNKRIDERIPVSSLSQVCSGLLQTAQAAQTRILEELHQLRSIAHVIDMHQLTKDPSILKAKPYGASINFQSLL